MLSNISWSTYLSIVFLLLVGYYTFVATRFYTKEIKFLLAAVKKRAFGSTFPASHVQDKENTGSPFHATQTELYPSNTSNVATFNLPNDTVDQVKELIQCVRNVIVAAVEQEYVREEFFLSLQLLLKNYSFLKGSPSVSAIDHLIQSECEKHGYLQLSAEERVMLWNE